MRYEANPSQGVSVDGVEKNGGDGEDERQGPGQQVEVRNAFLKSGQSLVVIGADLSQAVEDEAPSVDQNHSPDAARNGEVVDEDKNHDAVEVFA